MAEGGIYLCQLAEANGEYKLRLRVNPDLKASGRDLKECMDDICLQIIDWNGDGEAVLELFPPQGKKPILGGVNVLTRISYNDSARVRDYETLFQAGACSVCKFEGKKGRTELTGRNSVLLIFDRTLLFAPSSGQ